MIKKKSIGDNYRADDIGKIELEKLSMLSLILERDGRTQTQLAADCRRYKAGRGITQSVLSEYVNESRRMTEAHARIIAHVLGVKPKHLGRKITKEELVRLLDNSEADIELEDAAASEHIAADPLPSAVDARAERHLHSVPAPDYTRAEAAGLHPVLSIDEVPGLTEVRVWPIRLAASPASEFDEDEMLGRAWVGALPGFGKARIFAARITGTSMDEDGIDPGDTVFIRRSSTPKQGSIVVAAVHGGVTVKRLEGKRLVPHSSDHTTPIDLLDDSRLLGEVLAIHKPRR